eukprot:4345174-Pyramimonas_sp.AAC.2
MEILRRRITGEVSIRRPRAAPFAPQPTIPSRPEPRTPADQSREGRENIPAEGTSHMRGENIPSASSTQCTAALDTDICRPERICPPQRDSEGSLPFFPASGGAVGVVVRAGLHRFGAQAAPHPVQAARVRAGASYINTHASCINTCASYIDKFMDLLVFAVVMLGRGRLSCYALLIHFSFDCLWMCPKINK